MGNMYLYWFIQLILKTMTRFSISVILLTDKIVRAQLGIKQLFLEHFLPLSLHFYAHDSDENKTNGSIQGIETKKMCVLKS